MNFNAILISILYHDTYAKCLKDKSIIKINNNI